MLDADGLYAIKDRKELLKRRSEKGLVTVLTPHEGEFAYLGGDLSEGRKRAALRFAEKYGCILVLKGPATVTASPEGKAYINTTGNNGMAKGGSGDVLGGMVLSFLGQGMEPLEAAALAVYLSLIHIYYRGIWWSKEVEGDACLFDDCSCVITYTGLD